MQASICHQVPQTFHSDLSNSSPESRCSRGAPADSAAERCSRGDGRPRPSEIPMLAWGPVQNLLRNDAHVGTAALGRRKSRCSRGAPADSAAERCSRGDGRPRPSTDRNPRTPAPKRRQNKAHGVSRGSPIAKRFRAPLGRHTISTRNSRAIVPESRSAASLIRKNLLSRNRRYFVSTLRLILTLGRLSNWLTVLVSLFRPLN